VEEDVIKQELIGKTITVIDAKNPTINGIKGKVVNETKNTLTIKTEKKEKTIPKNQIIIQINNQKIYGKMLSFKPEDRIKITQKKIKTLEKSVKKEWKK